MSGRLAKARRLCTTTRPMAPGPPMPNGIFKPGDVFVSIAACDTSGISPSGKCDSLAFAYCMCSAATTNVRIRLRWTRTAGPRACGYPIWSRYSSARLAAIAVPKFGRSWRLPANRKQVRTSARTVVGSASPVIKLRVIAQRKRRQLCLGKRGIRARHIQIQRFHRFVVRSEVEPKDSKIK